MTTTDHAEARWVAVRERTEPCGGDPFVYAVTTTGIFCRPTCAAKRPKRENVVFFADAGDARRAGFRACKRCHPTGSSPSRDLVLRAIKAIEDAPSPPTGKDLADVLDISLATLRRAFKVALGLTPRQYADHVRRRRLTAQLGAGRTVSDAQYGAGYGSSSRLYETAHRSLGMTPGRFRDGAPGELITFATQESPLGWVIAATTGRGVCHLALGGDEGHLIDELVSQFPQAERGSYRETSTLHKAISAVIAGETPVKDLPLDIQATAFERLVWEELRSIPAGQTRSYREIAHRIGRPTAVRAVAQACARNRVALLIPCHRVVATDGSLAGYRWGVELKGALLAREESARPTEGPRPRREVRRQPTQ